MLDGRGRREVGRERRRLHVQVDDARAALANVPVEEADAEHDVRELVQLRHLVVVRQRGEGLEANAREDGLERRGDLALGGAVGARLEACAHDEEVEDLAVERGERLHVIPRLQPRLRDVGDEPALLALALGASVLKRLALLQPRGV